ncbi:MAG: hypothetical protein LBU45_05640, partial [Azoarcus sp.]|nr:hypothetical protein [Azoarcus sp.]
MAYLVLYFLKPLRLSDVGFWRYVVVFVNFCLSVGVGGACMRTLFFLPFFRLAAYAVCCVAACLSHQEVHYNAHPQLDLYQIVDLARRYPSADDNGAS